MKAVSAHGSDAGRSSHVEAAIATSSSVTALSRCVLCQRHVARSRNRLSPRCRIRRGPTPIPTRPISWRHTPVPSPPVVAGLEFRPHTLPPLCRPPLHLSSLLRLQSSTPTPLCPSTLATLVAIVGAERLLFFVSSLLFIPAVHPCCPSLLSITAVHPCCSSCRRSSRCPPRRLPCVLRAPPSILLDGACEGATRPLVSVRGRAWVRLELAGAADAASRLLGTMGVADAPTCRHGGHFRPHGACRCIHRLRLLLLSCSRGARNALVGVMVCGRPWCAKQSGGGDGVTGWG